MSAPYIDKAVIHAKAAAIAMIDAVEEEAAKAERARIIGQLRGWATLYPTGSAAFAALRAAALDLEAPSP